MLITACTGNENFPNGSCKFLLFVVPRRGRVPDLARETAIGFAAKANCGTTQQGNATFIPAAPGYRQEMGQWVQATYDVPEGTLLKAFVLRKPAFASTPVSASLLLLVRRGAAVRRISALTTGWEKAQYQRVSIEGPFDIVGVDQAYGLGMTGVPPAYLASFAQQNVQRCFEQTVLQGEQTAPPVVRSETVTNSEGEAVEVKKTERRRLMDI